MSGFRALAEVNFFGLDKIADMRLLANMAFRPKMRIRTQRYSIIDLRLGNDASLADQHLVADRNILQNRVGAYVAIDPNLGFTEQLPGTVDDSIGSYSNSSVDYRSFWTKNRHTFTHKPLRSHEP